MSSVWKQNVNVFISIAFIGTFGLGATLLILNAANLGNPIAEALEARTVLPDE